MTSTNLRNERLYRICSYYPDSFISMPKRKAIRYTYGTPIRYVTLHLRDRRIFAPLLEKSPWNHCSYQPRTQACSRYPSDQRRLGTERDSARRPRRIFPTSLTGDVTSEIAEDDWERGCVLMCEQKPYPVFSCIFWHFRISGVKAFRYNVNIAWGPVKIRRSPSVACFKPA